MSKVKHQPENLNDNRDRCEVVEITIPFTPPSVNHYKTPATLRTPTGPRKTFKLTPEARAFRETVWLLSRSQTISPDTKKERDQVRYSLTATVYLASGQRGDGDNFWKCIADAVEWSGIIHSDARVRRWLLYVEDCDRDNPRTVIRAERIERRTR